MDMGPPRDFGGRAPLGYGMGPRAGPMGGLGPRPGMGGPVMGLQVGLNTTL